MPICMAKTGDSFTDDPDVKGAPIGFVITVRDLKVNAGAGFIYPIAGSVSLMPGLPTRPCFYDVDIDTTTGKVTGLF